MKRLLLAPATPRLFVIRVTLAVAILQALWIAVVPPFRASDEFDHAYRAAAVADGQWHATETARAGRGLLVRVPADIVEAAEEQCGSLSYTGYDNCHSAGDAGDGHVWVASGAATYNPVFYWIVGTAAQPLTGTAALYGMRVVSALLCLIFLCLAAWALSRVGTPGWAGVGFVLALSPVFLFSVSMAAPNGLEMAAAVALWCSLLGLRGVDAADSRKMLVLAVCSAVVLTTLRALGPLFVLTIVALACVYLGRTVWKTVRRHAMFVGAGILIVGVATVASVAWTSTSGFAHTDGKQGDSTWTWISLLQWVLQTIAAFPYRDVPGPPIVYPVVALAVGALTVLGLRRATPLGRLAIIGGFSAGILLPLLITWVTMDSQGVMWQGRYGLPVSVGFILMSGVAADRAEAPRIRVLVPASIALTISWAWCYVHVQNMELERRASVVNNDWLRLPAPIIVIGCLLAWLVLYGTPRRSPLPRGPEPGLLEHVKIGTVDELPRVIATSSGGGRRPPRTSNPSA